jgi:anti-sigma factor RsiW
MKDTEFIQLLNLYLDHEISTADAARLEAEVQTNAGRRHIYQEYCRMQKACRMIAADFQTDPADSLVPTERKVIAFNPAVAEAVALRRRRLAGFYTVGSFAAVAACVAIIFVGRGRHLQNADQATPTTSPVASAPASAITNPDATFVASKSATPRGLVSLAPRPQQSGLVRDRLLLNSHSDGLEGGVDQGIGQLAWINSVQLSPLQIRTPADLHFAAKFGPEGRALGNRQAAPAKASPPAEEYLGFQFVR